MKKKSILDVLGLALVGTMIIGSSAFSQGKADKAARKEQRKEMGAKLAERLNVTADQKARLQALREQFKSTNGAALAEIKALREKMMESMKSGDKENAKLIREQIQTKMQALKPAREAFRAQAKAILTPEQLAELQKLKAERKEKIGERRAEWKEKHGKGTEQDGSDHLK